MLNVTRRIRKHLEPSDWKTERLRTVELFAGLSTNELMVLASQMDEVEMPAGAELTREGLRNGTFHTISSGSVAVVIGDELATELGTGDCFGEISMELHEPATATVVAITPVDCFVMSRGQYRAIRGNERLHRRVQQLISRRRLADRARGRPFAEQRVLCAPEIWPLR
jgi:CRP-like cAMP-binding protein